MKAHRLFGLIAGLLALAGAVTLSQATIGVGLICLGCLAAIFGRIGQASFQHDALLERLGEVKSQASQSRVAAERTEGILRQVHGIVDPLDYEPVAQQKKICAEGAVSSQTSGT